MYYFIFLIIMLTGCNNAPDSNVEFNRDNNYGTESCKIISQIDLNKYKNQAGNGDGNAAFKLFLHYKTINSNGNEWYYWLKKGAELNNAPSQYNLAWTYLHCSPKDKKMSYYWMNKAALNRHVLAKRTLKIWLSSDDIILYSKQAEDGNALASYKLYEYYVFIEDDEKRSRYWHEKAINNGYVEKPSSLTLFMSNTSY